MYYKIRNIFNNVSEYYVADQATVTANPHLVCMIGTEQEAQQKVNELKQSYFEQEKERFTISKETVVGTDSTWSIMDEANDPEEYIYQVFNTFTGLYEKVNTKTVALNRMNELKQQLTADLGDFFEVATLSELPIPPSGLPENRYGPTVGDIPVEVM